MIADVESRWVKRIACTTISTITQEVISRDYENVLQFRKGYPTLEIKEGRLDRVKSGIRWTDWQDVPVVEE
jgi:hypothetical protein